jgi:hypothetical protein
MVRPYGPLSRLSPMAPEAVSRASCLAAAPYLRQPPSGPVVSPALNSQTILRWLDDLGARP